MVRGDRADAALLRHLRDIWQLGALEPIDAGMSDAAVFRSGECFLKLARDDDASAALRQEIERTQWLAAQGILVPVTEQVHDDGQRVAWLSRALPGKNADAAPMPPRDLMPVLGRALRAVHALPVATCPFDETIAARLAIARRDIDAGAIDADQFDDRNAGVSPEQILERLMRARPAEELVVAHGDATLSNMIVGPDGTVGFVDCGRAGRADRYVDLAVLANYIDETCGQRWIGPFIAAYGEPAWQSDRARYFLDLYELF